MPVKQFVVKAASYNHNKPKNMAAMRVLWKYYTNKQKAPGYYYQGNFKILKNMDDTSAEIALDALLFNILSFHYQPKFSILSTYYANAMYFFFLSMSSRHDMLGHVGKPLEYAILPGCHLTSREIHGMEILM